MSEKSETTLNDFDKLLLLEGTIATTTEKLFLRILLYPDSSSDGKIATGSCNNCNLKTNHQINPPQSDCKQRSSQMVTPTSPLSGSPNAAKRGDNEDQNLTNNK